MQLQHKKAAAGAAWVIAVLSAGVLGDADSISTWSALTAIAVLPPLVAMRYWKHPDASMSESIREVLR
jgi:hypothetical protein